MTLIKWTTGKGQKGQTLILSSGEYEELEEALRIASRRTIYEESTAGGCGRFKVEIKW